MSRHTSCCVTHTFSPSPAGRALTGVGTKLTLILALSFPFGLSLASAAEQVVVDRSGKALREMRTDRPDATESPYTVDVGHVQLETDVVRHSRDDEAGDRTRETSVGAFNLRFGIADSVEAGVFMTPWTRQSARSSTGSSVVKSGFGDLVLRGKANFWGNDDGHSAAGIILDLSLPTARDGLGAGGVEGAAILPIDVELSGGWGLGAMAGLEFQRREEGSGYDTVLITTVTLGHDITDRVGMFVEATSAAGSGRHVATFDVGATYQVDPNLQFDVGANIGVSSAAADLELFVGLARRF